MAAPDDIQRELDQLDKRIADLRVAYDQYFLGMEKIEPLRARTEVQRLVEEIDRKSVRNTGAKFRREQLRAKFLSFQRYWDRVLKQIEEGTFHGHRVKAELHEREREERARRRADRAKEPASAAPPPRDRAQEIFEQLVQAKRQLNESVVGLTRDKVAVLLDQQTRALKEKLNCRSVEFRVVIEGGTAKLKAVTK